MNTKIYKILTDLNDQLNFLNIEFDETIKVCEKAIEIISRSLNELKNMFKIEVYCNNKRFIFATALRITIANKKFLLIVE